MRCQSIQDGQRGCGHGRNGVGYLCLVSGALLYILQKAKAMTMILKNKTAGLLSILAASVMWGIEPILAKLSYQTTDYLGTFATRTIFCFSVVAVYLLLRRKNPFAYSASFPMVVLPVACCHALCRSHVHLCLDPCAGDQRCADRPHATAVHYRNGVHCPAVRPFNGV